MVSSLVAGSLAVLILVFGAYFHALKIQAPKNFNVISSFVEGGLVDLLWTVDTKATQSLLNATGIDPAVVAAEVYNTQGVLIASYYRQNKKVAFSIEHTVPIMKNGISDPVGSFHMVYDSGLVASQSYTLAAMLVALVGVMSTVSGFSIRKTLDRKVAKPVAKMARSASLIGAGELSEPISDASESPSELQELSEALEATRTRIGHLLAGLQSMVDNLEEKVAERTLELSGALEHLKRAQASLVESEKFAALGSLVSGVAHDLNTPIGNARLALTSATHYAEELSVIISSNSPAKRSDIAKLCSKLVETCQLAEENAARSAKLVEAFMKLAIDRASEQKCVFELSDVIKESIQLSISSLKLCGITVEDRALAAGLELNSYPGTLGQIISHIIDNAKIHGLNSGSGRIAMGCTRDPNNGNVAILWLADDGKGIPKDHLGKVFDPFFTTRIGAGSSGLGLSNVSNLSQKVLGGSARIISPIPTKLSIHLFGAEIKSGTLVEIKIPMTAPDPKK